MSEKLLAEILVKAHEKEFAQFDNPPKHHFSLWHKMRMRKILSVSKNEKVEIPRYSRRFITTVVAIILLAVISVTAAAIVICSFIFKEHSDNTELFTIDYENCPLVIEDIYCIADLPNEYKEISHSETTSSISSVYLNEQDNTIITFDQIIKSEFNLHIDNENGYTEQAEINGCNGFVYCEDNTEQQYTVLVWDNGDYVLTLTCDLSKNEAMDLAKSTKIK